jgi:hypothetical protein
VRAVLPAHGKDAHRCNGPDPIPVLVHLKIFVDTDTVTTGDDKRRFVVTDDLGGTSLRSVHATITTVSSSGVVTVQIHNLTNTDDLLTTKTTIDASETTSYSAATPHVVDDTGTPPVNFITRGDVLRVDVDTAGTGAKGLEVLLEFGPRVVRVTP